MAKIKKNKSNKVESTQNDIKVLSQPECSLGFIEFSSISRGLFTTDLVIKKAPVKVVMATPISSGKFILLFWSDVASVEESFKAAVDESQGTIIKEVMIPQVHEKLQPFLMNFDDSLKLSHPVLDSVGIVESTNLAGAILAADKALKEAQVNLCKIKLGQSIGGKAFFIICGTQENIEASLEVASECLKELESFCRVDIVPNPDKEFLKIFESRGF